MKNIFIDSYVKKLMILSFIIPAIAAAITTVYLSRYSLDKIAMSMVLILGIVCFVSHNIATYLYKRHIKEVYKEMRKNSAKIKMISK